MFEALEEGSIDKLRSITASYTVDDAVSILLHRNANDETPLEFAILNNRSNGICAQELVAFLKRWHQLTLNNGELSDLTTSVIRSCAFYDFICIGSP